MNRLQEIFDKQALYVASLSSIYHRNGFAAHAQPFPWPLNDRMYQEEFRLLAWRFTEEIHEALDEWSYTSDTPRTTVKFIEEISDALHFFVELCLATNITPIDLGTFYPDDGLKIFDTQFRHLTHTSVGSIFHNVIHLLSHAMMNLRQRPWRTDQRPTDFEQFQIAMQAVWYHFAAACHFMGITSDVIYEAYFAKAKINEQRRRDALSYGGTE